MDKNDKDDRGNITSDEIVDIEGVGKVTVKETKDKDGKVVDVVVPQEIKDAGEEAVKKFKRRYEDGDEHTAGKTYKERMEWNKDKDDRQKELDGLNTEIEAKKSEAKRLKNLETVKKETPSLKKMFMEKLGKETMTAEEYVTAKEANPTLYDEVIENRQELVSINTQKLTSEDSALSTRKQIVENGIRQSGYKIADVESYMRAYGFDSLESAFNMYKVQNKPALKPIDIINKAEESRKNAVRFIDAGDAGIEDSTKKNYQEMTVEEINALPAEEFEIAKKSLA